MLDQQLCPTAQYYKCLSKSKHNTMKRLDINPEPKKQHHTQFSEYPTHSCRKLI